MNFYGLSFFFHEPFLCFSSKIVFVGTVGDGEFGDIAIDSVALTKGKCLSDWGTYPPR